MRRWTLSKIPQDSSPGSNLKLCSLVSHHMNAQAGCTSNYCQERESNTVQVFLEFSVSSRCSLWLVQNGHRKEGLRRSSGLRCCNLTCFFFVVVPIRSLSQLGACSINGFVAATGWFQPRVTPSVLWQLTPQHLSAFGIQIEP